MAFTLQTDPPTDGANAYISADFFRTYHVDRGRPVGDYADDQVQAAIVLATQYLDQRFEYVGWRQIAAQTTEWPRSAAYDNRSDRLAGIPRPVQQAVAEYALRALVADLLPDPVRDASGMRVTQKSEAVGPISESTSFQGFGGYELPAYPFADNMLISRGLTIGGASPNGSGLSSGDTARS